MNSIKSLNEMMSLHNSGVFYWKKSGFFRQKRFWVLKDINLKINHGDTIGIIGRNGAGKSTLLRLMAGIISPDKGEIVHNECRTSLLSLQVGFTPYLSGRENAVLNGMLLGMKRKEIEAKLEAIINFSELENYIDDPIRTYSAGMKARLGFAVALQATTDLLLIDEVIGVGDAAFRDKSIEAMKNRINSDLTVVLVSHIPQIISEVCNKVVWIEDGITRDEGRPDEILEKYHDFIKKHKFGYKTVT